MPPIRIVDEISKGRVPEKFNLLSEKERIELDRMAAEKERTVQEVLVIKSDRKLRNVFGKKIFGFVKCYIISVIVIFCVYQFVLAPCSFIFRFEIPTGPIMTLLGSMSITVIGLLVGVVRYLFPKSSK